MRVFSTQGRVALLFFLGLGQAASAHGQGDARLKLLQQFSYNKTISIETNSATIAFDEGRVYLTSPDQKVLKTNSLRMSSTLRPIFTPPGSNINRVYVFDGTIYVLVRPRSGMADHTVYQSTNGGRSFEPIDKDIEECNGSTCKYLEATELFADADRVYVNAGGGDNLFVTADEGETYTTLSGSKYSIACYDDPFAIFGKTVVLGGECKLDNAFLSRGVLNRDRQSWRTPLEPVQAEELENRKVNAVLHEAGTSVVYAALEGRLLRSKDGGKSFTAAYDYPVGDALYPYVGTLLSPGGGRDLTLAGGWNKGAVGTGKPFLTYGRKHGTEWTDISGLLAQIPQGIVTDLEEDEGGRIIAVVVDVTNQKVSIYQVKIPWVEQEEE